MKKTLSLLFVLALLLGLGSCNKSEDTSQILSTVPGSAKLVTVINIEKLINAVDAESSDNELKLNAEFKRMLKREEADMKLLTKGGVKLTSAVIFMAGSDAYLTGFIGNENVFRSYVEEKESESFEKDGKVETCGKVAIADDRFWISLNGDIDASEIEKFITLNEKSSMVSRAVTEQLVNKDEYITGVASTSLIANMGNMEAMALYQQLIGEVDFVSFTIKFNKGEAEADFYMLDSKYKPVAMGDQPLKKIDMSTVNMLEGDMQMLYALGIEGSVLKKILKQLGQDMIPGLDGLNGTVALGINSMDIQGSGLPAAMLAAKMTSGEKASQLGEYIKSLLHTGAKVSVKGSTLLVRTSREEGKLNAGRHLGDIEGSLMGVVIAPAAVKNYVGSADVPFDGATMAIIPDGDSFKLKIKAYTGNSENALYTLLKLSMM